MNLQYISDRAGHTTAVQLQIPIEDWNELKKKYKEFEDEELAASQEIPDWQIALGRQELKNISEGTSQLKAWDEVKKKYNL